MLYRLQIDVEGRDDALALAELIREMGYAVNTFALTDLHKLPPSQTRAGKIILAKMEPHRAYPVCDVEIWMQEADYKPRSAAPLLAALRKEGAIENVARGFYRKSATFGCTAPE